MGLIYNDELLQNALDPIDNAAGQVYNYEKAVFEFFFNNLVV